jgi:hypothetical protein
VSTQCACDGNSGRRKADAFRFPINLVVLFAEVATPVHIPDGDQSIDVRCLRNPTMLTRLEAREAPPHASKNRQKLNRAPSLHFSSYGNEVRLREQLVLVLSQTPTLDHCRVDDAQISERNQPNVRGRMSRSITARFLIEIVLAACSAVATGLSIVWPQWIEAVFEEAPDAGDGSAERLIAVVFLAAMIIFSWLARREWRRNAQERATASAAPRS